MLVITLWSQQYHHHVTGEKTRLERSRDICENTPESQRCPVSYKEVSTFWLILAQAGGLPAASVSHPGDCEMMGVVILHEVNLEWTVQDSLCFSHKLHLELCFSVCLKKLLMVSSRYNFLALSSTGFLTTCCGILPAKNVLCESQVLPASPDPAWRLGLPLGCGFAHHHLPLWGLLFPNNWKRQLRGARMIGKLLFLLFSPSVEGVWAVSWELRWWNTPEGGVGGWSSFPCQVSTSCWHLGSEPIAFPRCSSPRCCWLSLSEHQVTWFHDLGNHC